MFSFQLLGLVSEDFYKLLFHSKYNVSFSSFSYFFSFVLTKYAIAKQS